MGLYLQNLSVGLDRCAGVVFISDDDLLHKRTGACLTNTFIRSDGNLLVGGGLEGWGVDDGKVLSVCRCEGNVAPRQRSN
jgi:hypothetical protein